VSGGLGALLTIFLFQVSIAEQEKYPGNFEFVWISNCNTFNGGVRKLKCADDRSTELPMDFLRTNETLLGTLAALAIMTADRKDSMPLWDHASFGRC